MKKNLILLPLVTSLYCNAFGQEGSPASTEVSTEAIAVTQPTKSILKSARTKKFNRAMFFDQTENGVVVQPLELEYDLTADDGATLKMGPVSINEKSFFFSLMPLGNTHPLLSSVMTNVEAAEAVFIMKWPESLLQGGTLEMISKTGKVLWQYEVTGAIRDEWKRKLGLWKNKLVKKGAEPKQLTTGIFGTQLVLNSADYLPAFQKVRESFRFCISQSVKKSSTKLCSIWYGVRRSGSQVVMGKVRMEPAEPRVLISSETAPLKDGKVVGTDLPVSFYADLKSNISYEFIALPQSIQLVDIADTNRSGVLRVIGFDTRPISPSVILNPDQYTDLTKALGFEDTIGDFRKFWVAVMRSERPVLYFPGDGGGIFKQKFELSEVPRNTSRPYLSSLTAPGTYVDGAYLVGQKLPGVEVSSTEYSVKNVNDTQFEWTFKAPQKGTINKSYLDVTYQGKTYRSYFELYRGFSTEVSGRFTGIAAANTFLTLGEVAVNHWFENLLGWDHYWFSRLRWGVSAKYFQAFNKLKVDDAGNTAALSVLNTDLKYRLTPGLWGREETVGAMLSYQSVAYDKITAPMVGVGGFWARSMPRVFDEVFNIVPLMRYPKFVDMEFIYYPMSMKSDVTLNTNFALNFHGKVLWGKHLFGEAGFGMKRYAFIDATKNQQAELNTFYGTVGLGVNF